MPRRDDLLALLSGPTLLERVRGAWSYLRCTGHEKSPPWLITSTEHIPTGSVTPDLDTLPQIVIWQCNSGNKNCEGCPRFQAYWKGARLPKLAREILNRNVAPTSEQEADAINRDSKPTEVANRNAKTVAPISSSIVRD